LVLEKRVEMDKYLKNKEFGRKIQLIQDDYDREQRPEKWENIETEVRKEAERQRAI
jgi:hypothetical protein